MTYAFGITGSAFPRLGHWVAQTVEKTLATLGARRGFYQSHSPYAKTRGSQFTDRLGTQECVYLLGLGAGGHNAGASLIRCSHKHGLEIIANEEEERYAGIKHSTDFPLQSLQQIKNRMAAMGVLPEQIFACLGTWDYPAFAGMTCGALASDFPQTWRWVRKEMQQGLTNPKPLYHALWHGAQQLSASLGLPSILPIIGIPHHDGHAAYSYGVSPFAGSVDGTLVAVIDGAGDSGAISIYKAHGKSVTKIYDNRSFFDSLGHVYSIISSTQGGWTPLSSEGRYMGAAAWGNMCRLTNPFYKRLRQLIYFGEGGEIFLNRVWAQWHLKGLIQPYGNELIQLLGEPIALENQWNPDHVLDIDRLEHASDTKDRVDKAAALQLVFEDALFHILDHFIKLTGLHQLVLTGGCALNCVANMRLLDHFDSAYFQRYLGNSIPNMQNEGVSTRRLHLWIPPNPGDAGVPIGAAYAFALQHGASLGKPLSHAFYCGESPQLADIDRAVTQKARVKKLDMGHVNHPEGLLQMADLLAYLVANHGVIGLVQGAAETGPRALGHRSILANPCDPDTLAHINARVKHRERIRPLAPMATLPAAMEYFELNSGASDAGYSAYHFMVQTVRAKKAAYLKIPAVIHHDGTSRLQIVSQKADPFTFAFLQRMGHYLGVEIAVNTSLNVGSPMVQTPEQAVEALCKSRGLDGVLFVAACGAVTLVYDTSREGQKDGGQRLLSLLEGWQALKLNKSDWALSKRIHDVQKKLNDGHYTSTMEES